MRQKLSSFSFSYVAEYYNVSISRNDKYMKKKVSAMAKYLYEVTRVMKDTITLKPNRTLLISPKL